MEKELRNESRKVDEMNRILSGSSFGVSGRTPVEGYIPKSLYKENDWMTNKSGIEIVDRIN